ncbi:NACHT, LRR and PYD domains-containing protein 3-like [Discoglossus pictus]
MAEKHFVDLHMKELINRVTLVEPLLDEFLEKELLTDEKCNKVRSKDTSQAKMRELLQQITGCGNMGKDMLYNALKANDPFMMRDLEESSDQDLHQMEQTKTLDECRMRYMDSLTKQYGRIRDRNAHLGDSVSIDNRYTNLLMIAQRREKEEREDEIKYMGRKHKEIMDNRASGKYYPTSIQTLFDPGDDGYIPEVVVLEGPAGIGKTTTVQKIMFSWASGNLYQDKFKYVFCVSCREINNITGHTSLADIISKMCQLESSKKQMTSILGDCKNILLIIDGLDELKWHFQKETEVCGNPFEKNSMEILLNSILRKIVLPRASLIITTRPYSLGRLKACLGFPRYVEVMGFTEKNREQYFYNFFENKEQAVKAVEIIKENETLFTMCVVPITCWIVCTVMKQQMKRGLNVAKTINSIYLLYVKSLIKYHFRDTSQSVLSCVKKLCALAKDGVREKKILFDEGDIRDHGLSMSEIESTFLNENIFQMDIDFFNTYNFIHFSVQEFFAALHFVLIEQKSASSEDPSSCLMELLKNSEYNHHLTLTVCFLFGLCGEKQKKDIEGIFGCKISMRIQPTLEKWLRERSETVISRDFFDYFYETQDEDFVRRMMSQYKILNVEKPNTNIRAISYCLMNSSRHDHVINLSYFAINRNSLEILSPGLMKCSEIKLHHCDMTSSCCKDLHRVMITSRALIKLDLRWNELGDSGVKLLCDGLKHPNCTVQELRLERCGLTLSCCKDLHNVITTNRSLIKMDLRENKLGDSGVKLLCDGLKHPDCTLQKLGLECCALTSSCGADLQDVITTNRSLIKLKLSSNNLGDSGIKVLCDGLKGPYCTLQKLRLCDSALTPNCCKDLHNVITTNRSLITLDLSNNELGDSGVKLLYDGLTHPNCSLQELRLNVFTSINVNEYRESYWLKPVPISSSSSQNQEDPVPTGEEGALSRAAAWH